MVLCALPSVAFGFSDNLRMASADYILSGALRVNAPPVGDVIQCPSGLCQFMLHRTFPVEATGPTVNITIRRYCPDGSCSGNVGDQVCLEVVKKNQDPSLGTNNIALACGGPVQFSAANSTTMNGITETNLLGVVPLDTLGNACTGANCAGAELNILVIRNAGGSSNNINYLDLTLGYQ